MTETTSMTLSRDAHGQLVLALGATRHVGVTPVCAFAIAAPEAHIALVDTAGHELYYLEHLDQLPAPQRQLLADELALRNFMPELLRLHSVSSFATPSRWQVDTDRGPTELVLKAEEDIRRLPASSPTPASPSSHAAPLSLLITDQHGLHYRVRDVTALDRHSRRLLDRFM